MLDARDMTSSEGAPVALTDVDQLYQEYWEEMSGGTLAELPERRFAGNKLVGGYQAYRYRFKIDKKDHQDLTPEVQQKLPYNPSLLSTAGSVFVLCCHDATKLDEAKTRIEGWLKFGLDIPSWAEQAYGETYATNPFLPDNGYGEIAVNWQLPEKTTAEDEPQEESK